MSLNRKIANLERFIAENPAFADVPFMVVAGRPITPREALYYLKTGQYVSEILMGMQKLGIDPGEDLWILTEEFYRRLTAARPELTIFTIGYVPAMSPAEALEHVRRRDQVGRMLVQSYSNMLRFIRERVNY